MICRLAQLARRVGEQSLAIAAFAGLLNDGVRMVKRISVVTYPGI